DSFLQRWAMTIEGFEADISIPLTNTPVYGELTADTTPHAPSHYPTLPPCIDFHLRGKSMKIDGEHKGRVEQNLKDSSDVTNKTTSQDHVTNKVKKKKTRLPAYFCWAAVPFILFLIYILYRWLKRG
ncbi:MAG: hypothetical protein IJT97_02960, partial [Bacteroidaceae bacterium]|nr:hypothetical protein [Bacteroidaceae bacterium]